MFAITYRTQLLLIAAAISLAAVVTLAVFGLRLGIDFTGGSLTEVAYEIAPEQSDVVAAITPIVGSDVSVRASLDEAGRSAYLIRTADLTEEQRTAVSDAVSELGVGGDVTRFTSIGPVIGQELKDKAIWAIIAVAAVIIIYVAYAFAGIGTPVSSWTYGGITILVLVHDVLIPAAVMSILGQLAGIEADVLFVMALLAVLGYSVNDTIVVFDRVREKLKANRTEQTRTIEEPGGIKTEEVMYTLNAPYDRLVGEAVQETLARSINTSITTIAALVALYFFGGEVTQTFSLVLLAGVLAGTYSSICIASPLVVTYAKWRHPKEANLE